MRNKRPIRGIIGFLCVFYIFASTLLIGATVYLDYVLPDEYQITTDGTLTLGEQINIVLNGISADTFAETRTVGASYQGVARYMGLLDIKPVEVKVVSKRMVVPCGTPFGIKMFTDGVLVVGLGDIEVNGEILSPAKDAGLKLSDIIIKVDGKEVMSNSDVARIISKSEGKPIPFEIIRRGAHQTVYVKGVKTEEGYKAGIWVRDSSAGIGTTTFYVPEDGSFGGLGHPISDVDTGEIMPLSSGEVVEVTINSVKRGSKGNPGELLGAFFSNHIKGKLLLNNETGVYGILNEPPCSHEPVEVAMRGEVVPGKATILATVMGNEPSSYEVVIESVNHTGVSPTRNMVIRITDPTLLNQTGGIVQGMSGSPILQNGKLVGAVTHVFVNDPTRGYGIFAENMLANCQK